MSFSSDSPTWAPPSLPARIGINAVFLEPKMGGIDTYVRAIVPELVRLAPHTSFSVYCNPRGGQYLQQSGLEGVELITHPLLGRSGLKAASELTLLGRLASRQVGLLHNVAMTAPLRTRAVNVVMIHDVTWIVAPEPGEAATMRLWRVIVPPVARRADRVLTVSGAAAEHIVEHLRVPRERIDVVPQAAGVASPPEPTPEHELRGRLQLGTGPVVLTVSAKRASKNLVRLVEAMPAVLERWPDARLVLPGNPTPHERELRELAARLRIGDAVAFPDYVSERDLEGLYALASCFVFASLNEGFGIPILEAMRRSVPVVCAEASALPEVAGDAAIYFDPFSVEELSATIVRVLADPRLADELGAKGRERERGFTWSATARGTLESYARAWAGRHPAGAGAPTPSPMLS